MISVNEHRIVVRDKDVLRMHEEAARQGDATLTRTYCALRSETPEHYPDAHLAANASVKYLAAMSVPAGIEACHERLHRAGWSIGDVGTTRGWLVTGTEAEHVIRMTRLSVARPQCSP